ncbi:hypothetical protein [Paraburkholderia fungorum]|uniref:hypothetical protein n=1 Tax=Paraburkholderia fungorum TaxID=134537 RepID=UPI0038B9E7DA
MQTGMINHSPDAELPDALPAASSPFRRKRERIPAPHLRVTLASVMMAVALSGCGVFCGGAGGSGGGFAGGCATGMRF